jgi:drug/metabolite transporter (DMT)-like permease
MASCRCATFRPATAALGLIALPQPTRYIRISFKNYAHMDLPANANYLPFINAILYGLYYALLQETYGKLSLATILLTNALLNILIALVMWGCRIDGLSFAPLRDTKMLWIFLAVISVSTLLQVTHYTSLKNTSATYMAFAEISYPLFVPLFTYFLFSRSELSGSIALGGGLILLGSVIIARGY